MLRHGRQKRQDLPELDKAFRAHGWRATIVPHPREATMSAPEDVAKFSRMLSESRRAVVFTGAGISTESGIPDFRSPGGIWTKMMPVYFDEFVRSAEARRESWRRRFEMEGTWATVKPNVGHNAVAELVRRSIVSHVITQNI